MYSLAIIDDNRATADMLASTIDWEAIGCAVCGVAYDGVRGRLLIVQKKPDIIVADIRMPGLDGLQMVELAQKLCPKSRVVFISAYDDFSFAQKALQLRAADYLLKPFENDKLVRAVQRVTEEMEAPQQPVEDGGGEDGSSLLVNRILGYIRDNPSGQLSLQRLSQHFELTPSYISALIKKHTGRNYLEWVTDSRLKLAKKLLMDPTYRIEEIASVVGYKNYISFYNLFVKHEGLSPTDYRNTHQGKGNGAGL